MMTMKLLVCSLIYSIILFVSIPKVIGQATAKYSRYPTSSNKTTSKQDNKQKYWIFFQDKGPGILAKRSHRIQAAAQRLTARALKRRAKVRSQNNLVDETDIALYQPYLNTLTQNDLEIISRSRWLNAVTVFADTDDIPKIKKIPFVKSIQRVARIEAPPVQSIQESPTVLDKTSATHRFNYGNSFVQLDQIHAVDLHDAGITGRGVLVGMIDSGFRWQDHEAFQQLDVIAERDFVNDDDLTRNESGDAFSQDSHGTQTLSTLAGFKEGQLLGPAFEAQFVLAKTEDISSETPAEEDFWVEAIEWMDSIGVDLTSTSLGYSTFDNPQDSYTPAEMDGQTAIITQAAEIAVSKGIIILNSAGNEGDDPWRIITAPADGENVIAVGAVNSSDRLAAFSSRGPTADGRIKPDVMAMGLDVLVVEPGSSGSYARNAGTSFSCPLVAGVVAQILSAHPEVTPQQMLNTLRITANQAGNPDNNFGYGIINATAAITSFGPAFSNVPKVDVGQGELLNVSIQILSRAGIDPQNVKAFYAESPGTNFKSVFFTQTDLITYSGQIPRPASESEHIQLYFTVIDQEFGEVSYPANAPNDVLLVQFDGLVLAIDNHDIPVQSFELAQNFPNPFRFSGSIEKTIKIDYSIIEASDVRLEIFNILGQRVKLLLDAYRIRNTYSEIWDGRDDSGKVVASGVYFYVMATKTQAVRKKMLFLR